VTRSSRVSSFAAPTTLGPLFARRGFAAAATTTSDPVAKLNDQIKEFGKSGDIKSIWNSYNSALDSGVTPSILTYNLMLEAIGKTPEKVRAFLLFTLFWTFVVILFPFDEGGSRCHLKDL